jgi:hypothetical protein
MTNFATARCLRRPAALVAALALAFAVTGCASSKADKTQLAAKPPDSAQQQLAQDPPSEFAATQAKPPAPPPQPAAAQTDKPGGEIQPVTYDTKKDALNNPPPDVPATASVIRARVNNVPILDEDIRAACLSALHSRELFDMPEGERAEAIQQVIAKALQDVIDRELVLIQVNEMFGKKKPQYIKQLEDDAKKECSKELKRIKKAMKTTDDAELRKFFIAQGTTLEGYRRNFERNFMMMEFLRAMIFPVIRTSIGHPEIAEYYRQHGPEFDTVDNVVWQDIFIDVSKFPTPVAARQKAEQVRARAEKGEDFVKLVKECDQGDSNYREGEGTGHRRSEIRPAEVEEVLFNLKSKEVGPVVPVATGFHVVRVVKREYTGRKPLDVDLQLEIRKRLQNEMAQQEQRRIMLELRRKATIEVLGN